MAMLESDTWLERQEKSWAKPILTMGLVFNLIFGMLQIWFGMRFVTKDELHEASVRLEDKIDSSNKTMGEKVDRIYSILIDLSSHTQRDGNESER